MAEEISKYAIKVSILNHISGSNNARKIVIKTAYNTPYNRFDKKRENASLL